MRLAKIEPGRQGAMPALALAEPSTLVSDFLLGAFAAVFGVRLWRAGAGPGRRSVRLWSATLLAVAVAAFAGGVWHGFHLLLAPAAADAIWKVTLLAAGAASFSMLAGSALANLRGKARRAVIAAAGAKLVVYTIWMASHDDFNWVIADYGSALVAVLVLHGWAWLKRRERASVWMAAGVAVSVLAAMIEASGFGLHRYLNAHDLYHLAEMPALYLFYRGALLLEDAGA